VAVWIALGVALAALLAAIGVVTARAFQTWRTFRSLTNAVSRRLGELEGKALDAERKVSSLVDKGATLPEATARLDASFRRLAVLRAAAAEAQSTVSLVRGLVPRK